MSDWGFWFIEELKFLMPSEPVSPVFTPACNIYETPENLIIELEVPGVKKENLKIEIQGDILIIRGVKKEKESEEIERKYLLMEIATGPFERRIKLPKNVNLEMVKSYLEDGILTIKIPWEKPIVLDIEVEDHGDDA